MATPFFPRGCFAALSAFLAVAAGSPAQQTTDKPVPAVAEHTDLQESVSYPFGYGQFRCQQVWTGSEITANSALLTAVAFRADRLATPMNSFSYPQITVRMGHTGVAPTTLTQTFANNHTQPLVTVYQGPLQLPSQPEELAGTTPWNIAIQLQQPFTFFPGQGDLLLEIETSSAASGRIPYSIDAAAPGGIAVQYGARNPTGVDNLNLIASTGASLDPTRIIPGGFVDVSVTTTFQQYPGAMLVGIDDSTAAGQPLPLDLTPFGAPQNFLLLDPLVQVPHSWQSTFIGHSSTLSINIPLQSNLAGQELFAQALLIDRAFNSANLALTHGIAVTIGGSTNAITAAVANSDPNAATGTLLTGAGGQPLGAGVQLTGVFQ